MNEALSKAANQYQGFIHTFNRFFEYQGRVIDRLEQIERYGILSPNEARRKSLPYKINCPISIVGVDDYYDVIFLFPWLKGDKIPWSFGKTSLFINPSLKIVTPKQMQKRYQGNWVCLTRVNGGEVYVYNQIDPSYILAEVYYD